MDLLCVLTAVVVLFFFCRGTDAQGPGAGRFGTLDRLVDCCGGADAGRYGRGALPGGLGTLPAGCGGVCRGL